MWYWVRLPDGQQSDFNFDELKSAMGQGKVLPDCMARRHNEGQWFPVQTLLEQDQEDVDKSPAKYVSVVCGRCHHSLRIQLPIEEIGYPCPECRTSYKATKVSESPLIYVLMPAFKGAHSSSTPEQAL